MLKDFLALKKLIGNAQHRVSGIQATTPKIQKIPIMAKEIEER